MGNKACAIMLDTKVPSFLFRIRRLSALNLTFPFVFPQGPEIRSGKLADGKEVQLEAGSEFTLKYFEDDRAGSIRLLRIRMDL